MALLFMDSFDHYASADLLEKWTSKFENLSAVQIAAVGRRGGALRCNVSNGLSSYWCSASKTLAPSGAGFVIGVAVKFSSVNSGQFLVILDGASGQVNVFLNAGGTLSLRRGATVLATSTATVPIGSFFYLELKGTINSTTGSLALKVNADAAGWPTYSGNTQSTGAAQWTGLQLGNQIGSGSTSSTINVDFDDLYILDQSGAPPWNDFLGDMRVDVRNPTGAGAVTGWTPSAGSNWQNVDDATPNDDTDYNAATTASQTDTFVVQDAPVVGAAILGVQVCISAKKTDAGVCSIASVVRQGTTNLAATAQNPGTSYDYLRTVYPTNPHTSAQWTEADFNADEFGYQRTA